MGNRVKVACAVLAVLGLVGGGLVPAASAGVDPAPALGGPQVVELKAPTPDWYTPELHEKVVAARPRGEGVPVPAAARAEIDSALLFTGIRPGSWMIFPAWCTLNFVFNGSSGGSTQTGGGGNGNGQDKDKDNNGKGNGKNKKDDEEDLTNGSRTLARRSTGTGVYIGTAGHCTETGEEVTIIAAPGILMNIGRTVTSVDNGIGDDFALIEIHPEMTEWVNPSMAYVAGPTDSRPPDLGDAVLHVGHGLAVGTGGTPRAGVVTWLGEGEESDGYGWTGAASFGDSGSGVRAASGEAVGNLTHLVVGLPYAPADVAGTNIDRILQIARASLSTASLVPDPLP